MKIKMSKVLDIQAIYQKLRNQTLSISTNYKLIKLFNSIDSESEFYRNSLRTLIDNYGARDEEGQLITNEKEDGVQIQPDKIEEFQSKFIELMNIDVELPDITFTLKELENVDLSLDEFSCLYPFIIE